MTAMTMTMLQTPRIHLTDWETTQDSLSFQRMFNYSAIHAKPLMRNPPMSRIFMNFIVMPLLLLGITAIASAQLSNGETGALKKDKILFLGNSITLHGPSESIGWTGNWGMAASAEEKDYVHLVVQALTEPSAAPPKYMVRNIADFERQFAT